jgi:hypothetical protein
VATIIQSRKDVAANWDATNPVLAEGEIGFETDTQPYKWKVGDGVTAWSALLYQPGAAGTSPLTTKGDLYGYDTDGARIPVGTDGQVLKANSAAGLGVEWADETGGGSGDVVGPASAVDSNVAAFDGTTGKLIKDGGISTTDIVVDGDNISVLTNDAGYLVDITGEPINALSDVVITTPSDTEVLTYSGGNWVNLPAPVVITDHTGLTSIGTNTHDQIDTHIGDATVHFTEGNIDHTNILNVGTNTHAQIDAHITNNTGDQVASTVPNDSTVTGVNVDDALDTLKAADANLDSVKADKVGGAILGNFAGLDGTGNLTDSGFDGNSFMEPGDSIDVLGDVDTTGVTQDQMLVWNGTTWVPRDQPTSTTGFGNWTYRNGQTAPSSGSMSADNNTMSLTTIFYVNEINGDGADVGAFIENLDAGSALYWQQSDNSTNAAIYILDSQSLSGGVYKVALPLSTTT